MTIFIQHDGEPPHTAKGTINWLATNRVVRLNPGYSPDLNPLEHIWPIVTRILQQGMHHSKEELWQALDKAFGEVTPEEVLKLYGSMHRRLAAVVAARGAHTKY